MTIIIHWKIEPRLKCALCCYHCNHRMRYYYKSHVANGRTCDRFFPQAYEKESSQLKTVSWLDWIFASPNQWKCLCLNKYCKNLIHFATFDLFHLHNWLICLVWSKYFRSLLYFQIYSMDRSYFHYKRFCNVIEILKKSIWNLLFLQ